MLTLGDEAGDSDVKEEGEFEGLGSVELDENIPVLAVEEANFFAE